PTCPLFWKPTYARTRRTEVKSLLKSHQDARNLFEQPAIEAIDTELISKNAPEPQATSGDTIPELEARTLEFLTPSDNPDALGQLGQYEILEVIGRGGMGIVLRGVDPKLNRIVAVKVLSPDFAANPTAHKRFVREAQAAAAVSHDHVVTTYAVEEKPIPHLAMEYINGKSLQQKIHEEGQLEVKEVLRIARQIAAGLAAAHEQGLTHRDIKPSNILLQNGVQRVQITDFGLARATADVDITRTGEIAGTPQYMSPEQAKSEAVDPRSDLFSLGSVMYAMCCGRSPFRAESPYASIKRVCEDEPRSIRENNPEIPTWLEEIIFKLLEKNPDDRFQSATEVAELLGRHLSHLQDPAATAFPGMLPAFQKTKRRRTSYRRPLAASAAVILLAVLTLGFTEVSGVTNFTGTVIRLATGEGTLVIEVDDPSVEVSLDGDNLSISGAGLQELTLRPGQYELQATKDGETIEQKLVSISRGDREVVRVMREEHNQKNISATAYSSIFQLYKAGLQHAQSHDFEKSIEMLHQAYSGINSKTDPNLAGDIKKWYSITLFNRAKELSHSAIINERDAEEALRLAQKAAELQPISGMIWTGVGHALYRLGQYEEAESIMQKASRLGGQGQHGIACRALIQWELGKHQSATSFYEQAKTMATKSSFARQMLLILLIEFEEKAGKEILKTQHLRTLGNELSLIGNFQLAESYLRKAVDQGIELSESEMNQKDLEYELVRTRILLTKILKNRGSVTEAQEFAEQARQWLLDNQSYDKKNATFLKEVNQLLENLNRDSTEPEVSEDLENQ
ncbi:MAG: serine/threonine protein kinase, partial [Planctomycetaceae bacterium]|nr:serine/threonine protein kinase [Planctomycetaceae bacterium]